MQKIVQELTAAGLIFVAVFACYYNSLQTPMVFDDLHNILNNTNIHIKELSFQSLQQAAFDNPTPRPVAYVSFALNYYFGGLDVLGYHLVNNLILGITGLVVFWLLRFVMPRLGPELDSDRTDHDLGTWHWWIALAGALLFVVHPIQTQSVTYIVQRMASLSTMFYLAGLLAFLKGRIATVNGRLMWWALSLLLWVLALGTKQMTATLPLAIVLCEWILFQKGERAWLKTGATYLAIAGLLIGLVLFIFKGVDAHKLLTRGYSKRDFSLSERLLTEGRVMVHYVTLILLPLPSRLTLVYDYPISTSLFTPLTTVFSWLAIITSVAWSFLYARQYRTISFCVLWFFLHLAVESTVIPLEIIYEHRLFLPMFGVCGLYAAGVQKLASRLPLALVSVAVVTVLLGWGTHVRNQAWQSALVLWQDNLSKSPSEHRTWFNLGLEHMGNDDRDNALKSFKRTNELQPRFQKAFFLHALYLKNLGQFQQALDVSNSGLAIPNDRIMGNHAVHELIDIRAELLLGLGRDKSALQMLNQAIETLPETSRHYMLRAQCFLSLGQPEKAVVDYKNALKVEPDYFLANNNFAWLLATHPDDRIADAKEAVRLARHACELTEWNLRQAIVTLAAAKARNGEFEEAVKLQIKGIEMAAPDHKNILLPWLKLYQNKKPLIVAEK